MSLGRINSLVQQFEKVGEENKRDNSSSSLAAPSSSSSSSSRSSSRNNLPTSISEESIPKGISANGSSHQNSDPKLDATTQKLRNVERELSDLRRQHEKLLQKFNRLSVVFNDFKGVMEDEPTGGGRTRASTSLPPPSSSSYSSSPSPSSSSSSSSSAPLNSNPRTLHKRTPSYDPNSSSSPSPLEPHADQSPSLSSSAPPMRNPTKVPPQIPPRYTFNTHLTKSAPIYPTSAITTSAPKTSDIHDHMIEVFLRAQKTYCNNLQLIVEVFLEPLRQEVQNSTDPFITQLEVHQIFSHIEVILGSSQHLVETLQDRVDNSERPWQIGDIFLQATDYFKLYTPYIANYCQAFALLNKCKVDSPRFLAFIRLRERNLESKIKDLGSLLVLPVMRMSQYSNFIEEVLEATPEGMPDSVPLAASLYKMKGVVEYVKEKTLDYESQTNVQRVQSMLTGKFQNLNAPHRRYIMEGVLQEFSTNREYHCFLFNDILVIAKQKKGKLEHKSSIDLLYMEVQTLNDQDGKNLFCISPAANTPNSGQYSLQTGSIREKISDASHSPNMSERDGTPLISTTPPPSLFLSPPNSGLQLIFCASSRRDLTTWVTSLNEAIEQEIAVEKSKPKSTPVPTASQLKAGNLPNGRIDFENSSIEMHELIAQGGSGCKIHRCTVEGFTCVAKILNIKEKHQEVVAPFVREIMIIEQLRHQNITKYLGHKFTKNSNRMWLFLEYIPSSLEKVLEKRNGVYFPPRDVVWIALEIAKGIEFLHSQNIIHRDIKCGNILCNLDENNEITSLKITDFDTSKILNSKGMQLHTCIGTTAFMAPEVLDVGHAESEGYSLKVDIYSYGMLLIEILSLHPPYFQYDSIRVPEMVLTGTRPTLPSDLPAEMAPMVRFINQCTEFNPSSRPTAASMVSTLSKMLKEVTKDKEKKEEKEKEKESVERERGAASPSPSSPQINPARPPAPHPLHKIVKDYFKAKP